MRYFLIDSGQNMILMRKLEKNQRKTMGAVIEHTHAATQMREMTTVNIGRIIGRLMVIHVHDGRKKYAMSQDLK